MQCESRTWKALAWAIEQGYSVDREGIPRLPSGTLVKLRPNRDGYLCFTAGPGRGSERARAYVHHWVAYLKFGEAVFESQIQVRHKDGCCTNNTWDNILIGTPHENYMDRSPDERLAHAKKAGRVRRKLTPVEVTALRVDHANGLPYSVLSAKYHIAKSSISYLLHRRFYND